MKKVLIIFITYLLIGSSSSFFLYLNDYKIEIIEETEEEQNY